MRILTVLIVGFLIVAACSSDRGDVTRNRAEGKTVEKAVRFIQNQLMSQVSNAEVDTIASGMITIKAEGKGFVLDPSRVVTGLIDDDRRKDAVIPVYSLSGQSLAGIEYLVLLQSPSEFVIAATLTNILSIEAISDRMITAVVSTVTKDAPGYGCSECRDTVQYSYVNGELSRVLKVYATQ